MATQQGQQRPPRRLEACRVGIVLGVPSGDTLSILEPERVTPGTAPAPITLTLTSVRAPMLGKRVVRDGKSVVERDERWAWESREQLRQRVIGRTVVFRVHHTAGPRHYGEVWADQVSIRHVLVQEGWLDVTPSKEKQQPDTELEDLRDKAKASQIGIWSNDKKGAIRNYTYWDGSRDRDQELFSLFERVKNKAVRGIVDLVKTGTTLRIILLPNYDNIQLQLAGVRAPGFTGTDAEHYALEARFFTEYLLLHRDVTVTVEGIDKQSNLFGTVLDQAGRNISINLLRAGLASIVDWTASPKSDIKAFKEAERLAKEERLRIWKNHKEQPGAALIDTESVSGRVIEVIAGNIIVVRMTKGDEERRIALSSIQVPRFGRTEESDPDADAKLSEKDRLKSEEDRRMNYLAGESREFLRKAIIGKVVRCVQDYTRTADKGPERTFWSVYHKEKNVALDLVSAGLATVVPHGAKDPRSRDFQALLVAEKTAQKAGLGVHMPKSKVSVPRVVDLTTSEPSKSQPFLTALKRGGRVSGVVDYVFSGSRFKVAVPSESLVITLVLQGLAADRPQRAALQGKKVSDVSFTELYPPDTPANKALHIARERFYQRDVQIEIDNVDKGGNFVGSIIVGGQPWGAELVQQGLAKVHHPSAQRTKQYPVLKEAEDDAKKMRLGVWVDYDAEAEAAKQAEYLAAREAARAGAAEAAKINVMVTEILDGSTFWYQQMGDQTSALEALMGQMHAYNFDEQPSITPNKGDIVAAKFTIDDTYYRAEVQKVTSGDAPKYTLLYIDYGNTEVVGADRIRALPAQFSLNILPRQAHQGKLAFVRAPSADADFGVDAAALLKELVWDKPLVATVQFKEGQGASAVSYLSLGDPETKVPINAVLVVSGLARVQRSRHRSEFYDRLKEEEEKARKQRVNMWQHGDLSDSDDERA